MQGCRVVCRCASSSAALTGCASGCGDFAGALPGCSSSCADEKSAGILWSIIKSQAGTLGKAVLELVMNSIDAGASTVSVDLSGSRLVVSDDGKGFQSREEIENWFETFGTPHEKGDARYGRFRMGRGQVMAFTRNRWRSGTFSMFVDIRDLGLEYELTTESKPHKGCRIEGDLYEKLSPSEVIRVTDNLRELCKYAPIPG